jgi:MinD-like ATPase involved in chromosome partitioning or flagellar assembly
MVSATPRSGAAKPRPKGGRQPQAVEGSASDSTKEPAAPANQPEAAEQPDTAAAGGQPETAAAGEQAAPISAPTPTDAEAALVAEPPAVDEPRPDTAEQQSEPAAVNPAAGPQLGQAPVVVAAGTDPAAVHLGSGSAALPVGPVPVIEAPLPPTVFPEVAAAASGPLPAPDAGDGLGWTPSGSLPHVPSAPAQPDSDAAPDSSAGEIRSSRRDKEDGPEPASALTADRLLVGAERPPANGWRRWIYKATLGYVNLGDSDAVRIRRATEHRIGVRLGGHTRYVPVLSRKGGVGKTTVTTLLGMALADMREDRIIAMDANPDRGTLSDRSPGRADFTARHLVQNRFMVDSFAQLANYVTRDGSRLHVLASDTDPAVAQAFDDADYRAVTDILGRYYSIVLTDSGTGMVHSVMKGTLEKADTVVLVSGGSVDEARLASETLSWLEAHGRHDLVEKAVVVINLSSGNGTQVNVAEIEEHFLSRVRTVVRIPYDRHLAEGSRIDLARLQPATRDAVLELAALVVDELHG